MGIESGGDSTERPRSPGVSEARGGVLSCLRDVPESIR
jgi:hypothetical protein